MNKICDLHSHSVYSDGTFTPAEIIDEAIKIGLSAIALTDHNTVEGLPDFIAAAQGKNIEIVAGTELSGKYNGVEVHILALFIDPDKFEKVSALMKDVNDLEKMTSKNLVENLNRAGYDIDYNEIISSTPSGRTNRAHIALALMEKGYVSSIKEAFVNILSKDAGHYKEPKRLDALEILDFICSIHAIPVVAHPFLNLTESELIDFLSEAKKHGLLGMECYYSAYDHETTEKSLKIAKEFGLLTSGGSDFHGKIRSAVSLGSGKGDLRVPFECYLNLKKTKNQ